MKYNIPVFCETNSDTSLQNKYKISLILNSLRITKTAIKQKQSLTALLL